MLGLSIIKKLIINNSDLVNKDLEKGSNSDPLFNPKDVMPDTYHDYTLKVVTVNNSTNDTSAFIDIL